jgi:hypothetical protein
VCQKDGAAQLEYFQHAEDTVGGWVYGKEESVHYLERTLFETGAR